ncbi:DNA-binding protein [Mesorhizobium sp. M7A.F.Ca.MR.176.00.0.0]|uniref:helix-turn-helix domain-containing protein n=1 Tax=Mesorhizobium sp. M7A.F.Ca.MR.176.00.0.0 TaxID=2496776 RepID=UPI000FD4F63B|nr:helix-turn-helix domain-containing protein [Mesorhizobium sp. M7A.F.Ca.MR.176.00.0.0]RUU85556.1 DNA-binding protein [Mesorhizobium sp. M7A.F.Ca.MR.176.00.0.0]
MDNSEFTKPKLERLAYPINEACWAIGVGRSVLYRFHREGKVEFRKVGGRTLVPVESLRRLIEEAPAV